MNANAHPVPVNDYHINMVHVDETGIYFSGLRTEALLRLGTEMEVSVVCSLPAQAHNARPFRDGVLLNDTGSDCVRYEVYVPATFAGGVYDRLLETTAGEFTLHLVDVPKPARLLPEPPYDPTASKMRS